MSDSRIRLNRNKIPSRVGKSNKDEEHRTNQVTRHFSTEMVKPSRSDSDSATTVATGKSEKAIMKRLGGFVGEKPSSWPQNQVSITNHFEHIYLTSVKVQIKV